MRDRISPTSSTFSHTSLVNHSIYTWKALPSFTNLSISPIILHNSFLGFFTNLITSFKIPSKLRKTPCQSPLYAKHAPGILPINLQYHQPGDIILRLSSKKPVLKVCMIWPLVLCITHMAITNLSITRAMKQHVCTIIVSHLHAKFDRIYWYETKLHLIFHCARSDLESFWNTKQRHAHIK